jgi:hypothetical protein
MHRSTSWRRHGCGHLGIEYDASGFDILNQVILDLEYVFSFRLIGGAADNAIAPVLFQYSPGVGPYVGGPSKTEMFASLSCTSDETPSTNFSQKHRLNGSRHALCLNSLSSPKALNQSFVAITWTLSKGALSSLFTSIRPR